MWVRHSWSVRDVSRRTRCHSPMMRRRELGFQFDPFATRRSIVSKIPVNSALVIKTRRFLTAG